MPADVWQNAIPRVGEIPIPEEWLKYVVEKLKEDGEYFAPGEPLVFI